MLLPRPLGLWRAPSLRYEARLQSFPPAERERCVTLAESVCGLSELGIRLLGAGFAAAGGGRGGQCVGGARGCWVGGARLTSQSASCFGGVSGWSWGSGRTATTRLANMTTGAVGRSARMSCCTMTNPWLCSGSPMWASPPSCPACACTGTPVASTMSTSPRPATSEARTLRLGFTRTLCRSGVSSATVVSYAVGRVESQLRTDQGARWSSRPLAISVSRRGREREPLRDFEISDLACLAQGGSRAREGLTGRETPPSRAESWRVNL